MKSTSDISQKTWLTEKEACCYLSLSDDTLREQRKAAKLPYRIFGKRTIYYKREDLDKFMEKNTEYYKAI